MHLAPGKKCLQFFLDLLRAKAQLPESVLPAVGTAFRYALLNAADMALQSILNLVYREPDVALTAAGFPLAVAALQQGTVAPAVAKDDGLFAAFELCAE